MLFAILSVVCLRLCELKNVLHSQSNLIKWITSYSLGSNGIVLAVMDVPVSTFLDGANLFSDFFVSVPL